MRGKFALSVALRKESVDRNYKERPGQKARPVALRKESVDRNNAMQVIVIVMDTVALRKESVDRNCRYSARCIVLLSSLSARRAWIEIQKLLKKY